MFVYYGVKRSQTREKIIQTASDLFYRKGYNLTGINEIIAEAGIAKATLYSHFASKEEVCVAYLQARNETLMKGLKSFLAEKPLGEDQVLGILEFLIPFFGGKDFNGCWCIRTVAEIPQEDVHIRSEIQKQKQGLRDYILQVVRENLPNRNSDQHQKLATRTYLLYEGALAESHLQHDSWPIHANIDLLADLLKS